MIQVCPNCDGSQIYSRSGSQMFANKTNEPHSERFVCRDCDHRFDEPTEREPAPSGSNVNTGLAAKLDKMDPEDL